jgi:hypothetical protein
MPRKYRISKSISDGKNECTKSLGISKRRNVLKCGGLHKMQGNSLLHEQLSVCQRGPHRIAWRIAADTERL